MPYIANGVTTGDDPPVRDSGFEFDPNPDGLSLVVTGRWTDRAAEALRRTEVTGLTLNYARGFQEHNLDFLGEWPIKELRILARTLDDLTPVYRLADTLERLSVETAPRAHLDLRRLPWLTYLGAEWVQIAATIEYALALCDLFVMSYEAPDLRPLERNQALVSLRMKQHPRLESLGGLASLPALRELGLYGARRLSDFADLATAPAQLTGLDLDSCSGLTELGPLAGQVQLRKLHIGNCGPIDSLNPIRGLVRVETFYAYESTRIGDGDLTPLLGFTAMKDFRMMNRQHYRPTVAEVKVALGLAQS
jgi:internalin A